MKSRKILALLLTIAMAFSVVMPVSTSAEAVTADEDYGIIFSDTFDDGTAQGWAAGVVQSNIQSTVVTPTTLPTGENVLKAEFTGASYGTIWDSLYEPNVFKETDLVAFNGDNLIRIKARVKNASNYDIKVNRPDACGWGQLALRSSCYHHHAVAGLNDDGPVYGIGVSSAVNTNDYKNLSYLKNADGSVFDYTGIDFSDKWIDYTVVINGATNEQTVTASFEHNGETVTVYSGSNSTFAQPPATYSYAGREGESTFAGFERLTFSSVAIGTPSTIYIDSVSVENIPLDVVKTTITPNTSKGIIYSPQELEIKFTGDINYTDGSIVIEDKATGMAVEQNGSSYDAETKTFTAKFTDVLPKGDYILKLTEEVSPVNNTLGMVPEVTFANRNIEFKVFDSLPPTISGVVISGKLIPGRFVSVTDYNYSSNSEDEGEHIYEWYAADALNGSFDIIDGETESSLEIDETLAAKYIKVKMTAVSVAQAGDSAESNVLAPEVRPTISGLAVSIDKPVVNMEISADYVFSDANGDNESGSVITWYVSDTAESQGTAVATGRGYTVNQEDLGKYIYCTVLPKSDAEYLAEAAALYTSDAVGPVIAEAEFLASLNLLQNPGFEDGINHYVAVGSQWDPNIEALTGEARTGNGSLRLHKRPNIAASGQTDLALHASWGQYVAVEGNKRYLVSCYAKAISSTINTFKAYGSGMSLLGTDVNGPSGGEYTLTTGDFQHIIGAIKTSETATTALVGFTSFASRDVCDANIDDMYFGEIYISDFNVSNVEQIKIPKNGETRVTLTNGEIYNQFGTRHGLYDQEVTVEVSGVAGVYGDGRDIVVTDAAQEGDIEVSVVVRPTYSNPMQRVVTKTLKIHLFPYNTPMKPEVRDLKVSTTMPMVGDEVYASYTYFDENENEEENGTVIKWYVSDSLESAGTEVGTGRFYKLSVADKDKYIYCTVVPKNDAAVLGEGDLYTSEMVGPVFDKDEITDKTNLLKNPSFEEELEHYSTVGEWTPNIEPLYGEARTGDISLKLHRRDTDASLHAIWGQDVAVEAGKRYVAGCYAKSVDSNNRTIENFYVYGQGFTLLDTDVNGENKAYTNISYLKFHKVVGAVETTSNSAKIGFTSFTSRAICDANVDDLYFGELYISDFNTSYVQEITIPKEGEKKVSLTNGEIYNQLGTRNGLYDQNIEIEIPALKGVYVDGYNLIVTEEASVGSFTATLAVRPTYYGAVQEEVVKETKITLVSHGDNSPRATDVVITGTFGAGNTLSGTYKFLQINGKADNSVIKWLYSDTFDGTYYEIPGANTLNYTVGSQYADKFICMEVTPVANDGSAGTPVRSNILTKERAPFMENVEISGSFIIGGTLTASGKVCDYNGLTGSETKEYQWYVSDSSDATPVAIAGATAETFVLNESHTGKYIRVGIIPVSTVAPQRGAETLSKAYAGPAVPVATNVSISKSGMRLTAQYTYTHIHGIKEKDTKFEWFVDGRCVSTTSDYTINFEGTKNVTLAVTPYAEFEPYAGETVYVTVTLTGSAGGSGGGYVGGGGSGGSTGGGASSGGGVSSSGSVSGVTSVNDMTLTDPTKEVPEVKTDIKGHWGETYIKEMEANGVMASDEKGNFNPDKNVSREDMLTFLFKALKLEATEYKNEFNDITDGDFAKMLQTMVDNGTIAKDESFRPSDTITREEMCKILYISLKNAGKLTESDAMVIEGFEDFSAVSDWAKVYVNAIYSNKIMVGISDTHFDPKGTVTKAQAATMLVRINRLIEGGAEK